MKKGSRIVGPTESLKAQKLVVKGHSTHKTRASKGTLAIKVENINKGRAVISADEYEKGKEKIVSRFRKVISNAKSVKENSLAFTFIISEIFSELPVMSSDDEFFGALEYANEKMGLLNAKK